MLDATPTARLGPRRRDAHKGDFGRVLVVGGSRGMAGAPVLSGRAALRSGAGLVTVACPASLYPIVAAHCLCETTAPLLETDEGSIADEASASVLERAGRDQCVTAIGPGLGRHESTRRFARAVIEGLERPFVADADALFALAEDPSALARAPATGVVTPHEGEMARLLGISSAEVRADRMGIARQFARRFRHVLVLKGNGTLVAHGDRLWRSETGNPGMATAGAGDVLTGVVAALLAQGLAPYEAARLAVHIHGLAGDLAREERGEIGLIATDLLEALPLAFRRG